MKTCRKGLHQYPKDHKGCPECKKIKDKQWQLDNIDKVKVNKEQYYQNNIDKFEQYRADNVDRIKNNNKKHRTINAEQIKQHYRQNIEQFRQYGINNAEKRKIYKKQWSINNPDKINSIKAKRRAAKLNATPKWLTLEQFKEIQEFYTLAQELAWLNQDGKCFHVDHIIPLQGENACGLHVPWNLQLLPAADNYKKGNRY